MQIRKARISDVEEIHAMINEYAEDGLMLAKPRMALYENIRDFFVACEGTQIIGVGALHVIWEGLAEVRSLAVLKEYCKKGVGKEIVNSLINEAKSLGVSQVFALTYQTYFFDKCGFSIVEKSSLSNKVWKDCINCPKFPNCDEIAMIIRL